MLTESVADFTWALILAITRRLSEGERLLRRGEWKGWALDFMLGTELRGKQLGLVGVGRIGRAVAARAPAFGMRVAYTTRGSSGTPASAAREAMSLDRLLNTSDVVSLHVPLTPETRHLIDKRALDAHEAIGVSDQHGARPVVDEAALAWALQQHLIAGAALDVYENEPAVHPDLLPLENVLLVPHLAAARPKRARRWPISPSTTSLAVLAGTAAADAGPVTGWGGAGVRRRHGLMSCVRHGYTQRSTFDSSVRRIAGCRRCSRSLRAAGRCRGARANGPASSASSPSATCTAPTIGSSRS